jgi:hypothetical protein
MKLTEQLVGGFVAPGAEGIYYEDNLGPDFGNFIMHGQKLLKQGVSMGQLIDELTKLPPPKVPDREEDNSYEMPRTASGGEPPFPG